MMRNRKEAGAVLTSSRRRRRILAGATLAMLSALSLDSVVQAVTSYTWDSSGANPTAPIDGSGTWDTSTPEWSNSSTNYAWSSSTNSNVAVIGNGGTAGTITIGSGETIYAGAVSFQPVGSGSYNIAGPGTLNLGNGSGGTITLGTGVSATADSGLSLVSGTTLFVMGAGTFYDNATVTNGSGGFTEIAGGATAVLNTQTSAPAGDGFRISAGTLQETVAGTTSYAGPKLYGSGTLDMEGAGLWLLKTAPGSNTNNSAVTLTLTGSAGSGQISYAINSNTYGNGTSAALSVGKTGSNTWTLSAANAYTGSTTVSNGILAISGSIQNSSTVTVSATSSSATLQLLAASALDASGSLNVTTSGGYTATINLGTSSSDTQQVASFYINGVAQVPQTYSASSEPLADPSLFTGSGSLTVVSVPEPTGFALFAFASAGVLSRRRRRAAFAVPC